MIFADEMVDGNMNILILEDKDSNSGILFAEQRSCSIPFGAFAVMMEDL